MWFSTPVWWIDWRHRRALRAAPDAPEALRDWAAALAARASAGHRQAGRLRERADRLLEQAARLHPDPHFAVVERASLCLARAFAGPEAGRRQTLREAIDLLDAALRRGPDRRLELALAYASLTLAQQGHDDARAQLLDRCVAIYGRGASDEVLSAVSLNNWGSALCMKALSLPADEGERVLRAAGEKLAAAAEASSALLMPLRNLGLVTLRRALYVPLAEARPLYVEAGQFYQRSIERGERRPAMVSWSAALLSEGGRSRGEEAERCFAAASRHLEWALRLDSADPQAWSLLGIVSLWRARKARGEAARTAFAEARRRLGRALNIQPDYHEGLNDLGVTLLEEGEREPGDPGLRLLAEAESCLERAARLAPHDASKLNNLGCIWQIRAGRAGGSESAPLLSRAEELYRRALARDPGFVTALAGLARTLVKLALEGSAGAAAAAAGLAEARGCGEAAERFIPGAGAVALAAVAIAEGRETAGRVWLERGWEYGRLTERLAEDECFAPVRGEAWFLALPGVEA